MPTGILLKFMKQQTRIFILGFLFLLGILIFSCGGGDGGSDDSPPPSEPKYFSYDQKSPHIGLWRKETAGSQEKDCIDAELLDIQEEGFYEYDKIHVCKYQSQLNISSHEGVYATLGSYFTFTPDDASISSFSLKLIGDHYMQTIVNSDEEEAEIFYRSDPEVSMIYILPPSLKIYTEQTHTIKVMAQLTGGGAREVTDDSILTISGGGELSGDAALTAKDSGNWELNAFYWGAEALMPFDVILANEFVPGDWLGFNCKFTLSQDRLKIQDFMITFNILLNQNGCNETAKITTNISESILVNNGRFHYQDSKLELNGEFTANDVVEGTWRFTVYVPRCQMLVDETGEFAAVALSTTNSPESEDEDDEFMDKSTTFDELTTLDESATADGSESNAEKSAAE